MLVLKAALLGAPKSGKTQLMNRVKAAGYSDDYVASEKQSLAVVNRMLQTEEPIMLTTMLWEIPGTLQSKLQSQEFDVVFLCFDPRNQESFDALEEKINAQLNNGAGYDFVLIETKSDLDDAAIAVSETQLEAFKNKYGITRHVKTSAKADTGIDKVIDALQQVAQKQVEEEAQLLERSQHVSSLFGSSGKDREAGVQEWSSLPSTQPPSAPQPPAPLKPFKVSVLGGAESGKTQLILRIDSDTFSEHYRKTLGIDFSTKKFSTRAGAEFAAMFWDTPGVEAIPGSTMASLLDPNVVFLCFDPRNRNSF
ncbi:MAG: hypothetical protein JJT82_00770, partial [Legionellaceae bacterium]|nr:hypothetical protein [Legionellaceae bacterium]